MNSWIYPTEVKTASSYLTCDDFNRFRNNVEILLEAYPTAVTDYKDSFCYQHTFTMEDIPDVSIFNAIEEAINALIDVYTISMLDPVHVHSANETVTADQINYMDEVLQTIYDAYCIAYEMFSRVGTAYCMNF